MLTLTSPVLSTDESSRWIITRAQHPATTVGSIQRHTYDLTALRNGAYDPTTRVVVGQNTNGHAQRIERATLTPDGPGTISISVHHDGQLTTHTWGAGGAWLSARAHRLAARAMPTQPVAAEHPAVDRAQHTLGLLHLPASDTPYHELLPAILGQRITAAQASAQWRGLCARFGEPAPGPLGLQLPPHPERLLRIASWEFHHLGIEAQRAKALRTAARHAVFIDRTRDVGGCDARARLMQLPGIGVWTAAVAVGVSHGDPDALPIGDFHVKNTVAWALLGQPRGSDDEMLATLAPYAGQRWQVVRMLELCGSSAPRFAPKRRILNIAKL